MKILSLNVRGLSKQEKMGRIKKLLRDKKVDMAFFQETKQGSISNDFIKSLWWEDCAEFLDVEANGSAGGLLCILRPQFFTLLETCGNRNFIMMKVCWLLNHYPFGLSTLSKLYFDGHGSYQ